MRHAPGHVSGPFFPASCAPNARNGQHLTNRSTHRQSGCHCGAFICPARMAPDRTFQCHCGAARCRWSTSSVASAGGRSSGCSLWQVLLLLSATAVGGSRVSAMTRGELLIHRHHVLRICLGGVPGRIHAVDQGVLRGGPVGGDRSGRSSRALRSAVLTSTRIRNRGLRSCRGVRPERKAGQRPGSAAIPVDALAHGALGAQR
jgi:hypothetical protein